MARLVHVTNWIRPTNLGTFPLLSSTRYQYFSSPKMKSFIRFQSVGSKTSGNIQPKKRRPLRIMGLTISSGAACYLTYHWTTTPVTFSEPIPHQKSVHFYRKMPLRTVSRIWGKVNSIDLPSWLRRPALMLYVWLFGCNLEEAAIQDLTHYRNLGEFFRRKLKPDARTIDWSHSITSPSDGKILSHGVIKNGRVEQVKGVTYQLKAFLGLDESISSKDVEKNNNLMRLPRNGDIIDNKCNGQLLTNPNNELYHIIIYLAPGDYHRFHSPTSWIVEQRKHFPGDLLSVSPSIARFVQGLFNFNERAVYSGRWEHGFFSYTAVGATNVGSIKVYFDDQLKTNCGRYPEGVHFDRSFIENDCHGIPMKKGEIFGEFNLGSTIVLIFEAPKNFQFKVMNGQKIKFGEPIGDAADVSA